MSLRRGLFEAEECQRQNHYECCRWIYGASGITPVFAQETTNAEVIKEDVEAKNL